MRRAVALWLLVGMATGALGHRALADDTASTRGMLGATQQEAEEGYFALGRDTMVVVKPGSPLHGWLKSHLGQDVRLTIAPHNPSEE